MGPKLFNLLQAAGGDAESALFQHLAETFPEEIGNLVNWIADDARNFWENRALERSAWGSKYAAAIKVEYLGQTDVARVYVDEDDLDPGSGKPFSMFVMMTEEGVKPWSIKEALLNSKRIKTSSKGIKYILVPFRYRIPGKQKPTSSFAGVLPQDAYKVAKEGGKLGPEAGNLAGLTRYDNESGMHGQYMTFRCVTEKSKGWQHPGKMPTPVYPEVLAYLEKKIPEMISNYLEQKVKALKKEVE
jgi:hypothetical protein